MTRAAEPWNRSDRVIGSGDERWCVLCTARFVPTFVRLANPSCLRVGPPFPSAARLASLDHAALPGRRGDLFVLLLVLSASGSRIWMICGNAGRL